MDDIKFNSLMELKIRLKPALNSKVLELKRNDINFVNENDIWEFLRINKWMNEKYLSLATMVDDILNTDNQNFVDFVNKRLEILNSIPKKKEEFNDIL